MSQPLNHRQRLFIVEFTKDNNATQAAIRAGYSKKSATQQGGALRRHPLIKRAISQRQSNIAKRNEITCDRILLELGRIALAENREILDWKVKMVDKFRAMDMICKILGFYKPDDVNLNVTGQVMITYLDWVKEQVDQKALPAPGRNGGHGAIQPSGRDGQEGS